MHARVKMPLEFKQQQFMPKTKPDSIDAHRKRFEAYLGKRTKFLQWSRYKAEFLQTGLPLNDKNLKLFAQFKQKCPRKTLNKSTLNTIKEFQLKHKAKSTWLGLEIWSAIATLNPDIKQWQKYDAFYRAGLSFKSSRQYQQEEAFNVIFFALLYSESNAN